MVHIAVGYVYITISSFNSLRVLFLIHSAIFFSVVSGCADVLQLSFSSSIEVFGVRAAASDNAALSVAIIDHVSDSV